MPILIGNSCSLTTEVSPGEDGMLSGDSGSLSSGRLVRLSSAGTPSVGDAKDLHVDFLLEELETGLLGAGGEER